MAYLNNQHSQLTGASQPVEDVGAGPLRDKAIGTLLRERQLLDEGQVERVVAYQRQHGMRFGEAAVALKLATPDQVLEALSEQFHYTYTPQLFGNRRDTELVAAADPFSEEAEAFRELRSQLLMGVLSANQPRRAIAVMSADVGDGKTYVAANLAIAFSQLGGRTLLLDADMRTPRQHKLFEVTHNIGLSSILSGRAEGNVLMQVNALPGLYIMPVGAVPPNPLELVQRPAYGLLMRELLRKFDHVVVDTPAASHGADARVIAASAGAGLIVGRRGHTRIAALQALLKKLAMGPTVIAGVVMNEY